MTPDPEHDDDTEVPEGFGDSFEELDPTLQLPGDDEEDDESIAPTLLMGEATLQQSDLGLETSSTDPGPAALSASEQGRVFAERFEVLALLGEGGMGRVYHVKDLLAEGREVALKVLRPRFCSNKSFRDFFFKEIHAAQNFVSEFVVQVRDTGRSADGELFLTMDMVAGMSLSALLQRERCLQPRHALEIARQTLAALASGHEKGFIHRDVKPSNIMLVHRVAKSDANPFGVQVRLLDFGIAGMATDTLEGEIIGTPKYMSPEQVRGERLDARSDLFAVGVVLFEMISGQRLFEGKTLNEVTTAVLETDVRPLIEELDGLPRPIERILRTALQKDRDKRFQSAQDFIEAIEGSSAFREPRGMPAWAGSVLTVLAIGSIAEGAWIWKQADRIQELSDAGIVRAEDTSFRVEDVRRKARADAAQEYEQKLGERDREIADLTQQNFGQHEELTRKTERIAELTGELNDYKDKTTLDKSLDEQLETLRQENAQMAQELGKLRSKVQLIEDTNEPRAKMAACFDELLRRLEAGAGESAHEYLLGQQRDGVFFKENQDGRDAMLAVAQLARLVDPGAPALPYGSIGDARRLLDEVLPRELVAFELESKDWITYSADEESEAPDRRARLTAYLADTLAPQLESRIRSVEAARVERWATVLGDSPYQDATAAIGLARDLGQDVTPLFERFTRRALSDVIRADGTLDAQALADVPELDVWAAWLPGSGTAVDPALALDLVRLHTAKLWYQSAQRSPLYDPGRHALDLAQAETPGDWRVLLSLQLALDASESWPPREDVKRLFCNLSSSTGKITWIQDSVKEPTAAGESSQSCTLERRVYLSDGSYTGSPQSVVLKRNGSVFLIGSETIVDLRDASGGARAAGWQPALLDRLPPQGSPLRLLDLGGFAKELSKRPIPCLVIEKSGIEYWLSDRYGLVREVRPAFERELMHSNITR